MFTREMNETAMPETDYYFSCGDHMGLTEPEAPIYRDTKSVRQHCAEPLESSHLIVMLLGDTQGIAQQVARIVTQPPVRGVKYGVIYETHMTTHGERAVILVHARFSRKKGTDREEIRKRLEDYFRTAMNQFVIAARQLGGVRCSGRVTVEVFPHADEAEIAPISTMMASRSFILENAFEMVAQGPGRSGDLARMLDDLQVSANSWINLRNVCGIHFSEADSAVTVVFQLLDRIGEPRETVAAMVETELQRRLPDYTISVHPINTPTSMFGWGVRDMMCRGTAPR